MSVAIVMGSDSDLSAMQGAIDILNRFGVDHIVRCVSAHRDPHGMLEFASQAAANGIDVIIAGAGGAAHLPGCDDGSRRKCKRCVVRSSDSRPQ